MPIKLWVVITSGQIDDQRRVEPSNWFYTLKNVDLSMHFNITNWKPQVLKIYTSPWGRWESDMTERLSFHFSLSCIGEGNGNPLQCSCLENPRDGRAWWASVYGVAQSRTRLKRLSSSKDGLSSKDSYHLTWQGKLEAQRLWGQLIEDHPGQVLSALSSAIPCYCHSRADVGMRRL